MNKFAEFSSHEKAAKECGVSTTSVKRGLNRVIVKCVYKSVFLKLYFLHKKVVPIVALPILARNVNTSISYKYPSINQILARLGIPVGGYIKGFYLNTGKVYKKQWLFATLDKYNGTTPTL